MPKLCVFDASGYLFRAYHALPPLTTSDGTSINAVFGFFRMLSRTLSAEKPDLVAVCFDSPEATFRHEEFEDYKANRDEPDEDIINQIPLALELTKKWGLPLLAEPGFEADDLIATLAVKAAEKGIQVRIFSGDKDLLQLVGKNIVVRDEMRKKEYDPAAVKERYGINPSQLIDFQSLTGDSIDNVPGVPGVGPKTAAKLLIENGNLETLFKNFSGVKPNLIEKLKLHQERVFKNRRLVELRKDAPLEILPENCVPKTPNEKELTDFLNRLEFRGEFFSPGQGSAPALVANKKRTVTLVTDQAGLSKLASILKETDRFAYDTETDSPDQHHCALVGVSFSVKENEAFYIPVGHQLDVGEAQLRWSEVSAALKQIFEDEKKLKIAQNMKFDNEVLKRHGILVRAPFFDTMVAAYCLNPEDPGFGLKDMAGRFLGEQMTRYEDVVKEKGKTIADVPLSAVADYAGADAEVTLRLADLFQKRLKEEKFQDLFDQYEMPLVAVIQRMEEAGLTVDVSYLDWVGQRFRGSMKDLEKEIFKLAGEEFNMNSPKQLSKILFEKLKLPVIKKTKTGFSTNEAVLQKLSDKHPICQKILSFRELSKLVSTYIDGLLNLADPKTGKVHTSFHQTGTSTGRLSSSEPNLQNIPIRSDAGREIRQAFIASKGRVLISADYSQIDLRALAHMSGDRVLIETFQMGGDVHAATASQIFQVPLEKVDKDMRRKAKAINFGVVYGQQAWALSQSLGITVEEAQAFIDQYFKRYSGVKDWIKNTVETARKTGYVETLSGRRRPVGEINSTNPNVRGFAERVAMNTPIQGTSADVIKAAMIRLDGEILLNKFKTTMPVQVHDELLFDTVKSEVEEVLPRIKEGMENAVSLRVPLLVDIKMGPNWNDMKQVTLEEGRV